MHLQGLVNSTSAAFGSLVEIFNAFQLARPWHLPTAGQQVTGQSSTEVASRPKVCLKCY